MKRVQKSRIQIKAKTQSSVCVHDDQNLFGIENPSLSLDEEIRLPDIPSLTLVVRPFDEYEKEAQPSTVSIWGDGNRPMLEITAPPNCWVTVKLEIQTLRQIKNAIVRAVDCQSLAENLIVPYVTDSLGNTIASIQRQPDERVAGVIAG